MRRSRTVQNEYGQGGHGTSLPPPPLPPGLPPALRDPTGQAAVANPTTGDYSGGLTKQNEHILSGFGGSQASSRYHGSFVMDKMSPAARQMLTTVAHQVPITKSSPAELPSGDPAMHPASVGAVAALVFGAAELVTDRLKPPEGDKATSARRGNANAEMRRT